MTQVANTIIRASAGSGKTHELVRRMVRLLALDVPPESIVALTFTRKAAGEFFARLLQRLADFAEQPQGAGKYLDELAHDTRAKCLRLLRRVLGSMDRLRLGTLDSFFAAMVQSLPFELGLTGAGAIMSDHQEELAREEALDAVLVELMRPQNETARRELIEAWKQATLGSEGSSPARDLKSWISRLHEWFLDCPDETRWGDAERIWPDDSAPIWKADEDLTAAKAKLELALALDAFGDRARARWQDFFRDIADFRSGTPLSKAVDYMLDLDRGEIPLLREGRGEWKMFSKKSVALGPEASAALYHALQIIVGKELKTCCDRSKGRCRLLGIYERDYRRLVRGTGRLVFDDLALLLSGKLNAGGAGWDERWAQLRQDMEFRLNARYDHWLFDEFQDTSMRQWRVFGNLVDEVLQDDGGRRTFFAVGDLKQSIYLWREAEPELFLGVEERYKKNIRQESLRVSWRSCPQVLQMVNDTFGNSGALEQLLPGAMQWWAFEPHESSSETKSHQGHCALLTVGPKEDKDAVLTALLREVNPLARGLSCAVLVRGNAEAMRLAAHLRRELGCEVVCESAETVATDNPVTLALLSALQLAAHPQDDFAWQHLCLTPLKKWIEENKTSRELLASRTRRDILRGGFLLAAEAWVARLREVCPALDEFSEWRLRQFLELCAEFDSEGSRDVDAFLRFARTSTVAATGGSRALQVMTIHKSKGLEFDMVILPDQQVTILDDARRHDLLWERDVRGEVTWLLDRPPSPVVKWDGRLTADIERLGARAAFEGLCRLYVAMTRARRGLYLLQHTSGPIAARSESGLVRDILKEIGSESDYVLPSAPAMKCLYECGVRDWFTQHELQPALATKIETKPVKKPEPLGELLRAVNHMVQRRTPSGEESFRIFGRDLLSPQREAARGLGTLVHVLFAEIEWLDDCGAAALDAKWTRAGLDRTAAFAEARRLVLRALESREVRMWFEKSSPGRVVWCERSFDLLLGSEWISGVFDRVVLERDAAGKIAGATILDFKTDAVGDEVAMRAKADGYAPQLALYKRAVARLTGLGEGNVRKLLVFTALGRATEI